MVTINEQDVQKVLRALWHGTSQDSHLRGLHLVDAILRDPVFPASSQSREYALNHILTQIITEQLTHQRVMLHRQPPAAAETRMEALSAIRHDGVSGSPELLGWSWLYYHFVRVELYITAGDFCAEVGVTRRTLRRYQRRGMRRLTAHLIEAEQTARRGLLHPVL